ncbi:MAG: dienelactone hydrolase family protein [Pseudomonadota bacterium]
MTKSPPFSRKPEAVEYGSPDHPFEGFLFRTPEPPDPEHRVVLFHEYMGMEQHLLDKAQSLAGHGFTVVVADLYGKGIRPETHDQAHGHYRNLKTNRIELRRRALMAVEQARQYPWEGRTQLVSVLGFSMGGCAALEVARSGIDLNLAISVYGYLDSPEPDPNRAIMADLLVFHGLRDAIVPIKDLISFVSSASAMPCRCEIITYSNAGHGFCNPSVIPDPVLGNRYDPIMHQRTWNHILARLAEVTKDLSRAQKPKPQRIRR